MVMKLEILIRGEYNDIRTSKKKYLTLYVWGNPYNDNFRNSEDPDEMPHTLLKVKRSSDKKKYIF